MRAAGDLLARALEKRGPCRILAQRERPWASATFVGAQHAVRLVVGDEAVLEGIEEADFNLGEHLLADIVVVGRERIGDELIADLEALTIEDWRAPAEAGAMKVDGAGAAGAPTAAVAPKLWREPQKQPGCGTKRAYVPLAAA